MMVGGSFVLSAASIGMSVNEWASSHTFGTISLAALPLAPKTLRRVEFNSFTGWMAHSSALNTFCGATFFSSRTLLRRAIICAMFSGLEAAALAA